MQGRDRIFERARNQTSLGVLGDPERWGATAEIDLLVPGEIWTPQIIRVQCSDLLARSWDLIVHWDLDVFAKHNEIVRCGFELTIGVGQASQAMVLDLTAALSGYPSTIAPIGGQSQMPPISWECVPVTGGYSAGTVQLSWPIPAAAMAGRFVLGVTSGPTKSKTNEPVPIPGPGPLPSLNRVHGSVFAACSPRALV